MTESSTHEECEPVCPPPLRGSSPAISMRESHHLRPNPCRLACISVKELRAEAARRFTRAGIHPRYVDTVVVRCVIAMNTRLMVNPLNYCLAVGRRLQDESTAESIARWREFQRQISNTCPHGSSVERCGQCAEDRQRALHLFPSLRRYLPASFATEQAKDEKA
jgi:hypothetical protein